MPRRPFALLATAVALVVPLTACSGGSATKVARQAVVSHSPSPSPSQTPSPVGPPRDPLTGAPELGAGPVVGIKLDNERLAWPYQRGLDHAAIVYQELIEGGATRLLGVFEGSQSEEIGPVRSVRTSDAELVAQYGPFLLAFSGGNRGVLASIAKSSIVNASYDRAPSAYRIGEHRPDANNFYVRISSLLAHVHGGSGPRDIGLRFGALPAGAGTPVSALSATFSNGSISRFSYDPATRSWLAKQNAHRMTLVGGGRVAAQNVIVARVSVAPGKYVDAIGHRTPYTHSVGHGAATVFRDGVRIDGTWSRPAASGGTHFLDSTGHDIPLRPGQTWILLLPEAGSLSAK